MLTIILKILSILGILLLVLLGVLLSAILLVLFVPVTYRVQADRQEAVPDGAGAPAASPLMHISVKAGWLLGVLRVRFQYPDPGTVTVKLLCFTLFDSGKEDVGTKEHTKADGKTHESQNRTETDKQAKAADAQADTTERKITKTEPAKDRKDEAKSPDSGYGKEKAQAGKEARPKQSLLEKIRYTFEKIYARIKELWENFTYYKEVLLCEDTRGLAHHALMRLGRILKSIRPRKLRADIRFGTGSPDTTGYAFGVYGMFCSWLGKQVILTPDFERAVLAGELDAAGHIAVFKLLWHGLRLVTDRRLRELIAKLRNA